MLELVVRAMRADDEATVTQLHVLLSSCYVSISLTTIVCSRQILGWTFRGSKYCQLIRTENRWKRFQWAFEKLRGTFLCKFGYDDTFDSLYLRMI